MRLAEAEVYEVATFYDHFDVVKEGEPPPAPLTDPGVRIRSAACWRARRSSVAELAGSVDPAAMRVVRAPCIGRCAGAPAAGIGDREVDHATSEGLLALARAGETKVVVPAYTALDAYRAAGGYQLLRKVRDGATRGRCADRRRCRTPGCAAWAAPAFPAGRKWEFVRTYTGPA